MKGPVAQAMEEGALGLTTALIYAPNTYAKTPELIDLAKVSARCGGIYIAHICDESGGVLGAIQESIDIAQASGAPGGGCRAAAGDWKRIPKSKNIRLRSVACYATDFA
jgi:hypothetical protein